MTATRRSARRSVRPLLEKVPYMIVVGDRDMENKTVSVRTRAGEDLGAMSLENFSAKLKEVVDSKVIQ